MISLYEIAQQVYEADIPDDKMIKYKDKEGETKEMSAGAAKKQPEDHPAKQAYDKMAKSGDDSEKPGQGMGASDFERDFDDDEPKGKKDAQGREYDPMTGKGKGLDYRGGQGSDDEYFASMMGGGEPDDKPFGGDTGRDADSGAVDGPSPEDGDWDSEQVMTAKLDGEEVGDIIDQGEDHPNYDKAMDYVLQFDPDAEKVISGPGRKKDEPEVDGPSSDEWGGDISKVMSAKIDDEEVGDVIGDEDHPNYEKAIRYLMQFDPDDEKVISGPGRKKDETVIINGKKYRPIKESVSPTAIHPFKKTYKKIGGK
jgi:hypothetical protein